MQNNFACGRGVRILVTGVCLAAGMLPAVVNGAGQTETSTRPAQRATERVSEAMAIVRQLEATPAMKQFLQNSKGVLLVPKYGRAALGVGAHGGGGLLMLKQADGSWRGPAFYDLGGLTLGFQAGIEAGPVALVLNNDKAVQEFMKKNNFSLSADAGITVVNWSRMSQQAAGTGDVIAWSSTKGLFGDALAIGINDVRYNEQLTNAYYERSLTPADVAAGSVHSPRASPLQQALARAATAAK